MAKEYATGRERQGSYTKTFTVEATFARYVTPAGVSPGDVFWFPRFSYIPNSCPGLGPPNALSNGFFVPIIISNAANGTTGVRTVTYGVEYWDQLNYYQVTLGSVQWPDIRFYRDEDDVPQTEDLRTRDHINEVSWTAAFSLSFSGKSFETLTNEVGQNNSRVDIVYSDRATGEGTQTLTVYSNAQSGPYPVAPTEQFHWQGSARVRNACPPQWVSNDYTNARNAYYGKNKIWPSCTTSMVATTSVPGWSGPDGAVAAATTGASATPSQLTATNATLKQESNASLSVTGTPIQTVNVTTRVLRFDGMDNAPTKVTFQRGGQKAKHFAQVMVTGSHTESYQLGGTGVSAAANVSADTAPDGAAGTSRNMVSVSSTSQQAFSTLAQPTSPSIVGTYDVGIDAPKVYLGDGPVASGGTYAPEDVVDSTGNYPTRFFAQHNTLQGGLTLTQAETSDFEGANSTFVVGSGAEQWRSNNATLSVSANILSIVATAAASNAYRYVTSAFLGVPLGYRYVKIRFRSVGSANQNLRLATVQPNEFAIQGSVYPSNMWWQLKTGADGDWVETELDLFADRPAPAGSGVSATYYRNPINSPGLNFLAWCFFGLTVGTQYEIAWIRGVRKNAPVVGTWHHEQVANELPKLLAWTDGLMSLRSEVGTNTTVNIGQIRTTLSSAANATMGGWTASVPAPVASYPDPTGSGGVYYPVAALGDQTAISQRLGGGGRLYNGTLQTDIATVTSSATIACQPVGTVLYDYAGAGNAQAGGSYSLVRNIRYDVLVGARVEGTLVGASGTVTATRDSGNAVMGSGASNAAGRFVTGAPWMATLVKVAHKAKPSNDIRYNKGGADPGPLVIPANNLSDARRFFMRWYVTQLAEGGALCIDSARQWLHVGQGKQILTYHLGMLTSPPNLAALAFTSAEHSVTGWMRLVYSPVHAALFALGRTDSGIRVFRSRNGGKSIVEVLSVDARTGALERDSERGLLVLIYENEGYLSRKVSRDGGTTWQPTSTPLFDGNMAQEGQVLDMTQDARAAGALLLYAKIAGTVKVYRSRDFGLHWQSVLS